MKTLYHIGYALLKLRARLFGKKLVYIGKDYFIYHDSVVEIVGLKAIKRFSYDSVVQFLTGSKFYINNESVIDIENGMKVLHHGVSLRKNTFGFVIDNKQYNGMMELIDEGEVYSVMYSLLVTKTKVKKGAIYKIINDKGEILHQFPVSQEKLTARQEGDYIIYTLGKNTKKTHIGGFKDVIEEVAINED